MHTRHELGLQYILQGMKPRIFEELATQAQDMELSIANYGGKKYSIGDKADPLKKPTWNLWWLVLFHLKPQRVIKNVRGRLSQVKSKKVHDAHLKNWKEEVSFFQLEHRCYVRRLAPKEGDRITKVQAA